MLPNRLSSYLAGYYRALILFIASSRCDSDSENSDNHRSEIHLGSEIFLLHGFFGAFAFYSGRGWLWLVDFRTHTTRRVERLAFRTAANLFVMVCGAFRLDNVAC